MRSPLKSFLVISIAANISFFLLWRWRASDVEILEGMQAASEAIRAEELAKLSSLLVGYINKDDVRARLVDSSFRESVIDKPEENLIGSGTLVFTFDASGKLAGIQALQAKR